MAFTPQDLDFNLSPYTGLTRKSWIGAATYLLEGVFSHIENMDAPVVMPRYETEITYPRPEDPPHRHRAEEFEGLTRSFFLAAPLIKENTGLTLNGLNLRDYYKHQVLKACTPGDPGYVLNYEDMEAMAGPRDPFNTFQQTVETAALVICLYITNDQIWETYTKAEKDIIAAFLSSFGHQSTVPQNWRLFNMLDLAFLSMHGYKYDADIMRDHARTILNYYVGDGWYRDGHSFDYYSCWAFNVYTAYWNKWYGYENEPYIAGKYEEYSNKLMETYPNFFDRDGFTNMWGRSGIYRNAATSPLDANMMFAHSKGNPGLARRIASGSMLQFLTRDDFLVNGIPSIGFYGPFSPLVQGYSCAESPFWLGKAFLCLELPADHPFWTAREENGVWEKYDSSVNAGNAGTAGNVPTDITTVLNGPGLCVTDHLRTGITELRSGKIHRRNGDIRGMWDYSKLTYNSKFPWEAAPETPEPDLPQIESQQYVLEDMTFHKVKRCNVTFWAGEKEEVLYRRQFFDYDQDKECHWMTALDLADFAVPCGILRADRIRTYQRPIRLTLGSYGFPDNGNTEIETYSRDGAHAIVLKGRDHMGKEKSMAMTIYDGWKMLKFVRRSGTNPDSENSIVIYAQTSQEKQYGYEPYVLISQVLTRESGEGFTMEEIFPIREVKYTDPQGCGGYGPVTILLQDGSERVIDFEEIEGRLTL